MHLKLRIISYTISKKHVLVLAFKFIKKLTSISKLLFILFKKNYRQILCFN